MDEVDKLLIEFKKINDKVEYKEEEMRIVVNEYENAVREQTCLADKIRFLKRRIV